MEEPVNTSNNLQEEKTKNSVFLQRESFDRGKVFPDKSQD